MRIAICEDHPGDCKRLSKLLLDYFAANRMEAKVAALNRILRTAASKTLEEQARKAFKSYFWEN